MLFLSLMKMIEDIDVLEVNVPIHELASAYQHIHESFNLYYMMLYDTVLKGIKDTAANHDMYKKVRKYATINAELLLLDDTYIKSICNEKQLEVLKQQLRGKQDELRLEIVQSGDSLDDTLPPVGEELRKASVSVDNTNLFNMFDVRVSMLSAINGKESDVKDQR